ncbi:putative enoyl-CoA hydratase echA8 [Sporotomaculum syntrophicum]|uniref:Enoyl-CoA hydratase echA8 n=1 Tax=Sporotomaculum syntrophicum TaxID=182264 RepID=A0A9D2WQ92_9FIRM|nr:enoyl-CoA hydratase-related protein [Sporotomaculum syntrophicum]KAF1085449.1 putative enoyl-CoA hydratase echA8 [Sporotomaculum syntrophicum]
MKYHNLAYKKEDFIALITLNRPDVHNALDPRTWMEIYAVARECRFDQDVRVVIITGSGSKAFASGADIRSLNERETYAILKSEAHASLNALENLEKPVIAAIDGFALGGGCELALACDIRIATSRSKLGQPETGLGIIPGAGGTQRLQRLVGIAKAKELIFTGNILSAREAKAIGLLNKVVEQPEDLLPATKQLAYKIIANGPLAVSLAKISINTGANVNINTGLLLEKFASTIAFSTRDRL